MEHDLELIIARLEILEIEVCNILQNPGNIGKRIFWLSPILEILEIWFFQFSHILEILEIWFLLIILFFLARVHVFDKDNKNGQASYFQYFQDSGNNGDFNFQYFQDSGECCRPRGPNNKIWRY